METEFQAKYQTKKKIKTEIKRLIFKLKNTFNTIIFNAVVYKLNIITKSRSKVVQKNHNQKLSKLRRKNDCSFTNDVSKFVKSTLRNFPSYLLTRKELVVLSFRLEQHIPISTNKNLIYIEFEYLYQNLLNNIKDSPVANLCRIKTKIRNTCQKYSEINVPYKRRETIRNLSDNQNVVTMKQDKGGGVTTMDKKKYFHKFLVLLNSEQFVELNQDPTATTERTFKRILRKKLYPTGPSPDRVYKKTAGQKSFLMLIPEKKLF